MNPKTIKIIYWVTTVLFALLMLFSGISQLLSTESGNAVMTGLGYPLYLNLILGVAKVLGAIAILQNKFKTIKEWAYAGFTFDLLGASASFLLNGNGIAPALSILPPLIVMIVSYTTWKKMGLYPEAQKQ